MVSCGLLLLLGCSLLEKILWLGSDVARADAIPDHDERDGESEDKRRDRVDFRRDAAAEAAPDFEGQRVVSADQKECDGDFVHREREDEKTGGDEREF